MSRRARRDAGRGAPTVVRCMVCGRRWRGQTPPCGHDQSPILTSASGPTGDHENVEDVAIPGYRIDGFIGRGGFGTVLAATREADGLAVAIKLVHGGHSSDHERLRLESRALEMIGPPHVPELYATGTRDDGSPYFVFEHLTLPTLDARLVEWSAPLARDLFARTSSAILSALSAIHQHGFVHRDLKPENIFVSDNPPVAKLIDFGIAKAVGLAPAHTTVGLALGTPEYMSPEQCEGRADIDIRSDIYSIGVVLYELLTTRPPFFGTPAEVREAHIGRRPPRPSQVADVDPVFDDVLLRCLSKDPSRRFASAFGLKRALSWAADRDGQPGTRGRGKDGAEPSQAAERAHRDSEPALADKQRQYVALLFFEATAGTDRIKHALTALGGQLVSVEGSRCVAAFGVGASGNPVQRAHDSALALIEQGLCTRALVDHDRVRVRRRADGNQRIFMAATSQRENFPRAGDPLGVLFTTAAADMLAEIHIVDVRAGVVRHEPVEMDSNADATVLQLGSGPLIGRKDQLDTLLRSAAASFSERVPTLVTILAEAGFGKSHLCAAMLRQLRHTHPDAHIIQLRAREPLSGENHELLRSLLRAASSAPGEPPPDGGRDLFVTRLGAELGDEVWPAAALGLGWISTDAAEIRKLGAAPAALRSATARAAGEALRALSSESQVVCIVDDAHYADETTLDALEYATLAEGPGALWICVLATPSFSSARPAWAQRAARALRMDLPALARDGAAELCKRLLLPAENIAHEAVQSLVDQTHGNPLLLVELARGIKRHGLIRRHKRGESWYLASDELERLPDLPKVEWLAEREFAALPPGLAGHARLIAQLSPEFTAAEVEGVLAELERDGLGEAFPLDAQVGIHQLLQHGLLVTHRDGRFGFRHHFIRDHVAQSTPAALREPIHKAAVHHYDHTDAIPVAQRLPRLARHAAQSGHEARAAAIYLELAERAASRHSYTDAEHMYSRALALVDARDLPHRMRGQKGRGLMRYRSSRYEDALDDLDKALDIARQLDDTSAEIELLLDKATVLDWMQDYHKSRGLVEKARALAGEATTPLVAARLGLGLGRAHYRFRELDSAQALLQQAAALAEPLGDPGYETRVIALLLIATIFTLRNQKDEAERAFDHVIALCQERGDKLHLASALNNRRELWLIRRDLARAASDCERCRQIGRNIGLSELDYICAYNLAELYYYADDSETARVHIDHAIELEPSNSAKPLSRLLEARVLVSAGRFDEAGAVLAVIDAAQARARQASELDAMFIGVEALLHDALVLAIHSASFLADEWQALRVRAEPFAQPAELAELAELAGLTALRHGERAVAMACFRDALALCRAAPHLIEGRIERRLRSLEG